jgi:hypothetical protein
MGVLFGPFLYEECYRSTVRFVCGELAFDRTDQ